MKKIFIACSKWCYQYIPDIKKALELMGYEIILPNFYDDHMIEERIKSDMTKKEHIEFCKKSFEMSMKNSKDSDAILVLNYDKVKDGVVYENYIGGATFLEMYDSYLLNHPIFLCNTIPEGMLYDEIEGMNPTVINGDLLRLKYYLDNKFSSYFDYDEYCKIKSIDDEYLKAELIIDEIFKDILDKAGAPYIGHLKRVSDSLNEPSEKVAGLLHDICEDTEIKLEDLLEIGFSKEVIEIINIVTFSGKKGHVLLEEYNKYIQSVIDTDNISAINLKIADMTDNYSEERMKKLSLEKQTWFHLKYHDNLEKLKKAKEERKKVYVRH